jgi:hypothetical protein
MGRDGPLRRPRDSKRSEGTRLVLASIEGTPAWTTPQGLIGAPWFRLSRYAGYSFSRESMINVTGPSFTSWTFMVAPKIPVGMGRPNNASKCR